MDDMENLAATPGGWVRWKNPKTGDRVYLRYDMSASPFTATDAAMDSDHRISGRAWRAVPFDDIDAWVKRPEVAEILGQPPRVRVTPLRDLQCLFEFNGIEG